MGRPTKNSSRMRWRRLDEPIDQRRNRLQNIIIRNHGTIIFIFNTVQMFADLVKIFLFGSKGDNLSNIS